MNWEQAVEKVLTMLSDEEIDKLISTFEEVVQELDYTDPNDQLVIDFARNYKTKFRDTPWELNPEGGFRPTGSNVKPFSSEES